MDQDSHLTVDHLRAQPPGATVRWASDHLTAERPWATGWIDIRTPDGGPPDMAWVWTILDPEDPEQGEPERLWQFSWPHDLDIHSVFDPKRGSYVNELPVLAGQLLPAGVVAGYERLAYRIAKTRVDAAPVPRAIFAELMATGGVYRVRGAWSARTVCDALSTWATGHAGSTDLRFEWEAAAPDSDVLALVKQRAAGAGPTWNLGEGLDVVDGVMDDLLALDPDEAARMTTLLREAGRRLLGESS